MHVYVLTCGYRCLSESLSEEQGKHPFKSEAPNVLNSQVITVLLKEEVMQHGGKHFSQLSKMCCHNEKMSKYFSVKVCHGD